MINNDFFPTPETLVNKMISGIDFNTINTILEPSAGKGDICNVLEEHIKLSRNYSRYDKDCKSYIDTVEIEPDLQAILKDKGYRVVGNDFLKFNTYKHYDLIAANVPFSEGDKHILHMIELLVRNNGGKLRCLCNAETIKNPYSNTRKLLLQKLEHYNASIEYIQDAFKYAERKTNVEVAFIKLDIDSNNYNSIILDNLKQEELKDDLCNNVTESYEVVEKLEFINAIVKQYNAECKAVSKLIQEFQQVSKLSLRTFDNTSDSLLSLYINGKSYNSSELSINAIIKEIRYKYWKTLFQSDKMSNLMTGNIRKNWFNKLDELKNYDFSLFNIEQIQFDIKMSLNKGIEDTILNLFEDFTRYAMQDGSKNIHYFTGWKTNKAHKICNKIIMPYLNAYDNWYGRLEYDYTLRDKLHDLEKVFTYIDNGCLQMEHIDLDNTIKMNFKYGNSKNIECKYFRLTFFKKGTCHITFNDKYKKVLDRFNYIVGNLKGWLPPTYGNKNYDDMTEEEKEVINSYCGKCEYQQEVETNKQMYKFERNNMLLPENE